MLNGCMSDTERCGTGFWYHCIRKVMMTCSPLIDILTPYRRIVDFFGGPRIVA